MAFSTLCPHKGCHKHVEPYLDPKTDQVFCSECDRELTNLTFFVKKQLRDAKQFKVKKALSFAVKCQHCGKEERPQISKQDLLCPHCRKPHQHLSEPFKIMLREKLKTVGQDI